MGKVAVAKPIKNQVTNCKIIRKHKAIRRL